MIRCFPCQLFLNFDYFVYLNFDYFVYLIDNSYVIKMGFYFSILFFFINKIDNIINILFNLLLNQLLKIN